MPEHTAHSAVISPTVPRPPHVPDSLVYDFDLFNDPAFLAEPHARLLDLARNAPPIFWSPRYGGHWMVMSYEANFAAARQTESFSSELMPPEMADALRQMLPPGSPRVPSLVPIFVDPPAHAKYRMPLASVFSPKAADKLKGDIRALARELIGRIASEGRCEFMSAVAEPLPVQVFLKMMGLPLERMREYRRLVREHMLGAADPPEKVHQRSWRILGAMRPTILDRKKDPKDDLISLLWNIQIDGRPVTEDEVEDFALLLFIAGLDTVMAAMGFSAYRLASDPELQDRLRADPGLIGEAKEETLRRYTFATIIRRVAKDLVFEGVEMKGNERLFLCLAGADLDPRHFPNPERYELEREDKVHIAFNAGPHRCLGSHLARLELQILYEELMAGLPRFRIDPENPPTYHGGHLIGHDALHLVWDV
jgi:cytochrome P450